MSESSTTSDKRCRDRLPLLFMTGDLEREYELKLDTEKCFYFLASMAFPSLSLFMTGAVHDWERKRKLEVSMSLL